VTTNHDRPPEAAGTLESCNQPPTTTPTTPVSSLTIPQAHALMQEHRRCITPQCQQRTAALRLLADTGRYQLPGEATAILTQTATTTNATTSASADVGSGTTAVVAGPDVACDVQGRPGHLPWGTHVDPARGSPAPTRETPAPHPYPVADRGGNGDE
jgi:hypothetical protein